MLIFDNIKKICDEKEISIAGLEKAVGLGNGTIGGWRASSPRVNALKKVADYLEVPLEQLLEE